MNKLFLKKIFYYILFLLNSVLIFSNSLDEKCLELKNKYCEFGFVITNPQTGKIRLIYNDYMIFRKKYCPGSLLKPFAIIAYSQNNIIDPKETYNCPGYNDGEISCWLGEGHKEINLIEAITFSCNYYFYFFLKDKLSKKYYVDTLDLYNIKINHDLMNIGNSEFYAMAFGLSYKVVETPINMVYAYNTLFNGGKLLNSDGELIKTINQDEEVLKLISEGMRGSYLYGTSSMIFQKTQFTDIIAKTGTGVSLADGEPDWTKNNGWVILFYPGIQPTFSMLVVVEESRSYTACKIAGDLLLLLQEMKKNNEISF